LWISSTTSHAASPPQPLRKVQRSMSHCGAPMLLRLKAPHPERQEPVLTPLSPRPVFLWPRSIGHSRRGRPSAWPKSGAEAKARQLERGNMGPIGARDGTTLLLLRSSPFAKRAVQVSLKKNSFLMGLKKAHPEIKHAYCCALAKHALKFARNGTVRIYFGAR
jgi:hypothetical protein